MTVYNVHIYREMRLFFPAITADTPEQAARIAADKPTADAEYTEDCEGESLAALIDVAGDDEFTQSVTIDFQSDRPRKAVPELLEALQTLAKQADEDCPAQYRTRHFTDALEQAQAVIAEATAQQPDLRPV
jgi:aminoglycoside phosphotransferase